MKHALRLRAEDSEDLHIVAAVLQDALVAISDMEFLAKEHCFAVVANRFRWENCDAPDLATTDEPTIMPVSQSGNENEDVAFGPCTAYERVNCGIRFDGVAQVRCKGLDRRERGRILELLTIEAEPGAVVLVFAGGAAVRLEGASITCHIEDLGEPWPTRWRPRHPLADTA